MTETDEGKANSSPSYSRLQSGIAWVITAALFVGVGYGSYLGIRDFNHHETVRTRIEEVKDEGWFSDQRIVTKDRTFINVNPFLTNWYHEKGSSDRLQEAAAGYVGTGEPVDITYYGWRIPGLLRKNVIDIEPVGDTGNTYRR